MTTEIERNRAAYAAEKERLEKEHFGRVALLHAGQVVEIYNDTGDAYLVGTNTYGLGKFTIQKIGEQPISLGAFTMCLADEGAT